MAKKEKKVGDFILNKDKIIDKALEELIKKLKVKELSEALEKKELTFSQLINETEKTAHQIYTQEEKIGVKKYLQHQGLTPDQADKSIDIFMGKDNIITSIPNIRRSRAGGSSEKILSEILKEADIPSEVLPRSDQYKVNGYRADVVVPSKEKLLNDGPDGVFAIAVKRTLRERWAEDISIFTSFKNAAFIVISSSSDFAAKKTKDMIERGMKKVYIPDSIYEQYKNDIDKTVFKKLSDLPEDLKKYLKQK